MILLDVVRLVYIASLVGGLVACVLFAGRMLRTQRPRGAVAWREGAVSLAAMLPVPGVIVSISAVLPLSAPAGLAALAVVAVLPWIALAVLARRRRSDRFAPGRLDTTWVTVTAVALVSGGIAVVCFPFALGAFFV
jgi:hypothetical protein